MTRSTASGRRSVLRARSYVCVSVGSSGVLYGARGCCPDLAGSEVMAQLTLNTFWGERALGPGRPEARSSRTLSCTTMTSCTFISCSPITSKLVADVAVALRSRSDLLMSHRERVCYS